MQEDVIWIDEPLTKFAKEVSLLGIKCTPYICKQLLKEKKCGKRKMSKCITLKNVENRNEQFENINQLMEEYIKSGNPIMSGDVKKKEMMGNFYREGNCYCSEPLKVYDHDFNTFSEGFVVPHGLFDIQKNEGYMILSSSKDTVEFNCDCIKSWWTNYGKQNYPNATSILILCDGGGSNTSRGYLFKEQLQNLCDEIGIEIRIAHYPPYTSKHNPIEHRLFSYVSKQLQGSKLLCIEDMAEEIGKTTTETGLKVFVNISTKIYETGKKVLEEFKKNCPIKFDEFLGKWNYVAVPQNREVIF